RLILLDKEISAVEITACIGGRRHHDREDQGAAADTAWAGLRDAVDDQRIRRRGIEIDLGVVIRRQPAVDTAQSDTVRVTEQNGGGSGRAREPEEVAEVREGREGGGRRRGGLSRLPQVDGNPPRLAS